MDFNTQNGTLAGSPAKVTKLGVAAQAMARDIRAAVSSGELTRPEITQLGGVQTDIVGDAGLAGEYIRERTSDIRIDATDIGKTVEGNIDSDTILGDNGISIRSGNIINGIQIIEGKVGGKIPIDEYQVLVESSIKNRYGGSNTMTLGSYTTGSDSYIARAGEDSTYFDMGNEWSIVKAKYGLTNSEMFDYFNVPALDYAITCGKTFRFSHNPLDYSGSFLANEWEYLKFKLNLTDENLILEGGFWYVG